MVSNVIVKFDKISKAFPGVKALDKVSFEIDKGEVHAIIGENGAGKSTLLNILHGVYTEYDGNIYVDEQIINFKSPHDAIKYGIAKVHQEINLINELTVGQNVTLGYEPAVGPFINYKDMYKRVNAILERLHCKFSSEDRVASLSVGEMQMVSVAKALFHNAKVISLDEPTASLTDSEVNTLFEVIRNLKENGITIIYVSHRLEEIFRIADRTTVLRDGKVVSTYDVSNISREKLIKNMVGRDVSAFAVRNRPRRYTDEVVLEIRNLTVVPYFYDISFKLRKCEILGFFGLIGSKRTEIMRTIFGADRKDKGEIIINGVKKEINSPGEGMRNGIGLIPENRATQGFVKNLTNAENIALTCLENFTRYGFLNHSKIKENCEKYIKKLNLTPKDPLYYTEQLSGGNQQKVVLAKWLSTNVDIFIFDEPTKGIDVGAKQEIYNLLEDLVEEGKSIIMVSSDLPEVIGMSDRVVVMREGHKVVELDYPDFTEEKILHYAMGDNNDWHKN